MIIDSPKERIAAYVAARTGSRFFGGYSALASECDGEIRCAAVFDFWRGADIEMSVAGERFSRRFFRACGRYVFGGLKCLRVTLRTRTDNYSAINAALRIGAQIEGVQKEFYDGDDALLLGVMRKDFRFDYL